MQAASWWKKRASCLEATERPISIEAISVIKTSGIKQEKASNQASRKRQSSICFIRPRAKHARTDKVLSFSILRAGMC
jgi:hypothetical protein